MDPIKTLTNAARYLIESWGGIEEDFNVSMLAVIKDPANREAMRLLLNAMFAVIRAGWKL